MRGVTVIKDVGKRIQERDEDKEVERGREEEEEEEERDERFGSIERGR